MLVITLFIGLINNLKAQQPQSPIDSVTLRLILETTDDRGKETGAVIILKDSRRTINEKGLSKLVLRVLGKVYNKEAMLDYSRVPLGYNSFYEEPKLNYARVIHKDGTISEVSADAIQLKTMPEREGLNYTDIRYLSFALSGMEPGAAFDFQVTFTEKIPKIEGEWFDNHWFGNMLRTLSPPYIPRIDPVITSRYTLTVPAGTKFQSHFSVNPSDPEKRTLNNQDEYTWVYSNLKAVRMESSMPDLSLLNPTLITSSLKDWSRLDQWAAEKILSKIEVNKEITDKTNALVSVKSTRDEKIKSISNYIQNNIQYIYTDLNRGGYAPHNAGEVFRLRYGDCKDQTVLFISMLKALGIESYPALINPFPYEEFIEIPTPSFSHIITYIPGKPDLWLDMTSGVTPFPDLIYVDQGRTAFIINGKGGKLVKTPTVDPGRNISSFDLQSSFDGGAAYIKIQFDVKGAQNDLIKSLFKGLGKESSDEIFKKLVLNRYNEAEIDTIEISDLQNPDDNFKISIKYHFKDTWEKGQEFLAFGSHAILALDLLTSTNLQNFPISRYNDIVTNLAYTIRGTERYNPADRNLLPFIIPDNDALKDEYFTFNRTFTREGEAVTARWSLTVNKLTIPKEKYESYQKSIKNINDLLSWNFTFVEPKSCIKQMVRDDSPANILLFCNSVLSKDPENTMALLLRAWTFLQIGQMEPSISEFQKVLKISPENKYAQTWICYPLFTLKKNDLALIHLSEAIRIDPEFDEAVYLRGSFYASQKSYDKALKDLNKAAELDTTNVFTLQTKSQVLVQLGKSKEAIASLEMAIIKDSTNGLLYSSLSDIYLTLNQYQTAVDLLLKAVKYDPDNSRNYGNLGWSYYMLNDNAECINYSLKAISIDPAAYYAGFNMAIAHLRSGNFSEARRIYGLYSGKASSTPEADRNGAAEDLKDLISKGIYVKEIESILKEFF
jgi:tetratricopeptide (TPR) repeat protein